jgi:hypothetical protein
MFLTGQLFPRPWDEPEGEIIIKKDRKFYDSSNTIKSIWDNPARASKKIKAFYHGEKKVNFDYNSIYNLI